MVCFHFAILFAVFFCGCMERVIALKQVEVEDPLCAQHVPCWTDKKQGRKKQCVPLRVVIGAAKSGTDLLWNLLAMHPELAVSPKRSRKELNFLNYHAKTLWSDNAKQWAKMTPLFDDTVHVGSIDLSTRYLTSKDAPVTMFRALEYGDRALSRCVRLVVVLRDPVEQLFSMYRYFAYKLHRETRTSQREFEAFVTEGMEKLRSCRKPLPPPPRFTYFGQHNMSTPWQERDAHCFITRRFHSEEETYYLRYPLYAFQLSRWQTFFNLQTQLLVLRFEDFDSAKGIQRQMDKITDFFAIRRKRWTPEQMLTRYNNYTKPENLWQLSADMRKKLRRWYGPPNEQLYQLLGKRLWDWPAPPNEQ